MSRKTAVSSNIFSNINLALTFFTFWYKKDDNYSLILVVLILDLENSNLVIVFYYIFRQTVSKLDLNILPQIHLYLAPEVPVDLRVRDVAKQWPHEFSSVIKGSTTVYTFKPFISAWIWKSKIKTQKIVT